MSSTILFLPFAGELKLLAHTLRHYRDLGVQRMLVDIQCPPGEPPAWLDPALAVLKTFDAEVVNLEFSPYTGTRARRERALAHAAAPHDWVVIADADEFQVYPLPLAQVIAHCEQHGYDHVAGRYVDRVAADGALVELDQSHPETRLDAAVNLTAGALGGWVSKVVLARPGVIVTEGNHEACYGRLAPASELFVEVHHFKWHRDVLQRNLRIVESIRERGGSHWIEKVRFERLLRDNGGRIPVEHTALEARGVGALSTRSGAAGQRTAPPGFDADDPMQRRPFRTPGSRLLGSAGSPAIRTCEGRSVTYRGDFPLDWLWEQLNGRQTLGQILLRRQEITGWPREAIDPAVRRALDALVAVGAVGFSRFTPPSRYDLEDLARSVTDERRVRLLYIDEGEPDASKGYGFPRAGKILELLGQAGFDVTLFGVREADEKPGGPIRESRIAELDALLDASNGRFDAIWVSRLRNLEMLAALLRRRTTKPPVLYDSEAVVSHRDILWRTLNGREPDAETREAIVDRELRLARHADVVFAVSARERGFFRDANIGPVHLLPSPIDAAPTPSPFHHRRGVFFLNGMYSGASRHEAVDYLVGDILPGLEAVEDLDLWLYGYGSESLRLPDIRPALESRLHRSGYVDDLFSMYDSHRICVIPTRCASGVAWKAVESLAHGVPVITTPLIAGQLEGSRGVVLAARDADEFAHLVCELYRDAERWNELREAGLDYVRRHCDREAVRQTLITVRKWLRYRLRFAAGAGDERPCPRPERAEAAPAANRPDRNHLHAGGREAV